MRALRAADPVTNSVISLARRFDCSRAFVQITAPLSKELRKAREDEVNEVRAGWGDRKKLVRAIRAKRRSLW